MTDRTNTRTIFQNRGVSFHDIALGGKLGGRIALTRYLAARRSQFLRLTTASGVSAEDVKRAVRAVEAFTDALAMLERLAAAVETTDRPQGRYTGQAAAK